MSDSEKNNSYRIGQFAKKMGVTPDFLKFYEQQGILHPRTAENGYRYYGFEQSGTILECMRLKNYGFSVREIDELLSSDLDTVQEKTDLLIQRLEEKILFQQRIVSEHRKLSQLLERMGQNRSSWSVEWGEEMLFLPHSNRKTFLENPEIYEILKSWISLMPLVKSAMELPQCCLSPDTPPQAWDYHWGLIISKAQAQEIGLPVNPAVKTLPRRRLFQFYFKGMDAEFSFPVKLALEQLNKLGLTPTADAYSTVFLYGNMNQSPSRCGVISIPID